MPAALQTMQSGIAGDLRVRRSRCPLVALTCCVDLPVQIPLLQVDRPCRTGVGPSQFDPNRKFWCQRDLII